jgi:DNA replication protein DnaC
MDPIKDRVQKLAQNVTPSPTSNGGSSKATAEPMPRHDLWLGFDAYCPKLVAAKRRVAEWFNEGFDRGEALVLAGSYGSGKTHLARVVLGACEPHLVHMISEPDLVANIRATYDGDGSEKLIIAQYRRARLLILDDVGTAHVTEKSKPWLEDVYWRILDRRAEMGLPTMLTTNLSLYELGQRLGGRALSRLQGMMGGEDGYVDMFGVADYRMRGWQ